MADRRTNEWIDGLMDGLINVFYYYKVHVEIMKNMLVYSWIRVWRNE